MKILIVEDFRIDQEEIVEMLHSFTDLPIEEIRTCEDGMEALDLLESFFPDVILCDVEMPYMDGFELLKTVRRRYQGIRFVFCSLYNRMEYLKNALDLDSNGYLLKPLNAEDLHQCLKRFLEQNQALMNEREELSQLREQVEKNRESLRELFVINLLHGCLDPEEIQEKQTELEIEDWFPGVRFAVVEVDDYFERAEQYRKEKRQQYFYFKVWQTVYGFLQTEVPAKPLFFVQVENARFCCGFRRTDISAQEFLELAQRTIQKCKEFSFSATIAVEPEVEKIDELTKAFDQCTYMLRFKYSTGKGSVLYVNDIPGAPEMKTTSSMIGTQKDLRYALNQKGTQEIERFLDGYYQQVQSMALFQQKTASFSLVVCAQLILNETGDSLQSVFGQEEKVWEKLLQLETAEDTHLWVSRIFAQIHRFLQKKRTQKEQVLIEQVQKYIEENLGADLHLEGIANHFYYSPNYLNSRFKKKTNMTISEYIKKEKIERSKQRLLQTRDGISEIASQIGFEHVSYFNYVFKRMEGMTPREYRQKYGEQGNEKQEE